MDLPAVTVGINPDKWNKVFAGPAFSRGARDITALLFRAGKYRPPCRRIIVFYRKFAGIEFPAFFLPLCPAARSLPAITLPPGRINWSGSRNVNGTD
jgi:hypothetical protein